VSVQPLRHDDVVAGGGGGGGGDGGHEHDSISAFSVLGVDAIVALIATTHEDLRALSLVPRFVRMDGRCLPKAIVAAVWAGLAADAITLLHTIHPYASSGTPRAGAGQARDFASSAHIIAGGSGQWPPTDGRPPPLARQSPNSTAGAGAAGAGANGSKRLFLFFFFW
jgi:hypothetical protein